LPPTGLSNVYLLPTVYPVYFVTNVASVSGFSIPDCPLGSYYLQSILCLVCQMLSVSLDCSFLPPLPLCFFLTFVYCLLVILLRPFGLLAR